MFLALHFRGENQVYMFLYSKGVYYVIQIVNLNLIYKNQGILLHYCEKNVDFLDNKIMIWIILGDAADSCINGRRPGETGWDLGPLAGSWDPLLQCCNACTWTHLSLSNPIQRNCMGLKITACMCSWDKLWTKDTKRPKKPQLPLLKGLEQNQGTAHAPCTQHYLRGGQNT